MHGHGRHYGLGSTKRAIRQEGATFGNAQYLSSGETKRRHVRVQGIVHIGKEANRWEEQFFLGYDPKSQVAYGKNPDEMERLRRDTFRAAKPYGVRELSRASNVSVGAVSAFKNEVGETSEDTLRKILWAIPTLEAERGERQEADRVLIERVRRRVREDGLRAFAEAIGADHGNLAATLAGRRPMSRGLRRVLSRVVGEPPGPMAT